MKTYYDLKRSDQLPLKKGSKVWLEGTNITPFQPMKKLAEKQYGPFEILKLIRPSSYHLKIPTTWKGIHPIFNKVLLTPFHDPLPTQSQLGLPPIVQGDLPDTFKVKVILNSMKRWNKTYYLVKWLGYGHKENT